MDFWMGKIVDWEAVVEIIWPLSTVMEDLCVLCTNLPVDMDRKKGITEWREVVDGCREFQDKLVTLT